MVAEHRVLETKQAETLDDPVEYETIVVDPAELQPDPATTTAPNLQTRELVIVDTATPPPDYQQLIDDILV